MLTFSTPKKVLLFSVSVGNEGNTSWVWLPWDMMRPENWV